MIYLDSSVVLARLFFEDRVPQEDFWAQPFISSSLLTYEIWTVIHSHGLTASHTESVRQVLDRIQLLDLSPVVLGRALQPYPRPLRTLDALHLASIEYLRNNGQAVQLASYDNRLNAAAQSLGIPLAAL